MAAALLECPDCHAPLPDAVEVAPSVENCPSCGLRLRVATFPALFRQPGETATGLNSVESGEATCFHHEQKRAIASCEACGKFLCQLCDVEAGGNHFCAQCFENGARKGDIPEFERGRTRYDNIMVSMVVAGFLFWFLILVPVLPLAAVILGIVKRKEPPSLVHRSRLRMNIAMALAILQVVGGCAFWIVAWASS